MEKLSREEVIHVAHLARIGVSDEEINDYSIQLKELLNEVEKINNVEVNTNELLVSPVEHITPLREDENKNSITFDSVKKNAPRVDGNFIEVPVMINE